MSRIENLSDAARKRAEIWNASDPNHTEFLANDYPLKERVNIKDINSISDGNLVFEYKARQDPFKILKKTKYFSIPFWLLILLGVLGVLAIIGIILAIVINVAVPSYYLTYNDKCGSTNTCNPNKNLICTNSKCGCKFSTLYWDGSTCAYRKNYGETCSSDSQCQDIGLYCSTSGAGTCNCPKTSTINMCDCQSTKYYDEISNTCADKLYYGSSCSFDNACRTDLGLYCDNTTNTCSCIATQYWSTTSLVCTNKRDYTQSCTITSDCMTTKGLVCSTTANSCNCPQSTSANACDCPSTGYYYDYVANSCVATKTINQTCANNYECDSTKSLTCSGGMCVCSGSRYWSITSSACIDCPATFTVFFSRCYYLSNGPGSNRIWASAQSYCTSNGGNLCTVTSNLDLNLLSSFLNGAGGRVWIGASEISTNNFQWVTGYSLSLADSMWCSGEPDNTGPGGTTNVACVTNSMTNTNPYGFCYDDYDCGQTLKFCCEIK